MADFFDRAKMANGFFFSIVLPLVVKYIAGFGRQFSAPGQMKTVRYQGLGCPLLRGLVALAANTRYIF